MDELEPIGSVLDRLLLASPPPSIVKGAGLSYPSAAAPPRGLGPGPVGAARPFLDKCGGPGAARYLPVL